jgi:hypothetical protein
MSVVNLPSRRPWADIERHIPAGYVLTEHGLYLETQEERLISGPCWVSALTRSNTGDGWGRVIHWIDQDGNPRGKAFPAQQLTARGQPLADELQALGLHVIPGEQRHLMPMALT